MSAVYLGLSGVPAIISRSTKKSEVVAYEELRAENVRRLEMEDFPVTVANDVYCGDLYENRRARYRVEAA